MTQLLTSLSSGVPAALEKVRTLGRALKKRAAHGLAYFERPGTSNGPTEAINPRLEHLCGSALGIRNLTNFIARALLEPGGFKPRLHPQLRRASFVLCQRTQPSVASSGSSIVLFGPVWTGLRTSSTLS